MDEIAAGDLVVVLAAADCRYGNAHPPYDGPEDFARLIGTIQRVTRVAVMTNPVFPRVRAWARMSGIDDNCCAGCLQKIENRGEEETRTEKLEEV